MAIAVSYYGCNLILETLLGRASFPANLWVALSTQLVDPAWDGDDLAFFEPTDSVYERQQLIMDDDMEEVDAGGTTNANDLVWDTPTQEWGRISFFALCDDDTSGQVIFTGDLSPAFTVSTGGSVKMLAGSIVLNVGSITDYGTDS